MADKKSWYRYTDESGKCWRIKATERLAEIGGLQRTDESTYPALPELIKPRYVWMHETSRPKDRLPKTQKVIIEHHRLAELWDTRPKFLLGDIEMVCVSYYGETIFTK
jgi:hypothetical protein